MKLNIMPQSELPAMRSVPLAHCADLVNGDDEPKKFKVLTNNSDCKAICFRTPLGRFDMSTWRCCGGRTSSRK